MPRTPDMFSGWFDNQATQQREHWDNGVMGRYAHRRCIQDNHPNRDLRAPFGTHPDLPENAGAPAHG